MAHFNLSFTSAFPRLLAFILLAAFSTAASATLSFELRSGNTNTNIQKLAADSNNCPAEGPRAAYVGGIVRNTTGSKITDASVTLGGLNSNVYLAGGQPATQYLGTLDAGQSIAVYWFTGYECSFGSGANASITMNSSAGAQIANFNLVIANAISANAGGQLVGSSLGSGAVVGQTVYFDAQYDFSGSDRGDEFILQPSALQTFDADCFQMVGSEVTSSNVAGAPVGMANRLYTLQTSKQAGNGYFVTVRYYFTYRCAGRSTTAKPYAVQTSGTQLKYTGTTDASIVSISFPGATNPFQISKTVDQQVGVVGATGNLTYTIQISNPSVYDAILDRIVDTLPAGMTFIGVTTASDVQASNSSEMPPNGSSGILNFVGRKGSSYFIRAGGSVSLQYTVSRPPSAGDFTNSARGVFGSASTAVAQATYSQSAVQPVTATKVSSIFSDPKNGTTDPFAIPGAIVEYTIGVSNPNPVALDQDSVKITDSGPQHAALCLVNLSPNGPIAFIDGAQSSGLAFTFSGLSSTSDDVEFSSDDGATWTYVPNPDASGCDSSITNFRILPKGQFKASSSFAVRARYQIK